MKNEKILTILSVCCICLAVGTTAWADFVGVVTENKIDAETAALCGEGLGLTVCNVFMQFNEDDDRLLAIGFADLQVMNGDSTGVFYHHRFGGDVPSSCALLDRFPDLICDSYVAIGEECAGLGTMTTDGDFLSTEFNLNGHVCGGWHETDPNNGQGDAGNYPDLQVLVLQSSVAQGLTLSGDMDIYWRDGDTHEIFAVLDVPIECAADCGDCPTDANGDGETGAFDLAALLAAWGPLKGNNCQDADYDGEMGAFDLATLLAAWGPCP